MNKNKTILILLGSFIAVAIVVLSFFMLLNIIKSKNEQTSKTLIILQEKIKEKDELIMFAEKISELKNFDATIDSRFVDETQINKFADYLESVGEKVSVRIVMKSIEIPAKTKNTVSFKILISGDFGNVMKMVYLVENIPYQVTVNQVYLSKGQKPLTEEEIEQGQKEGKLEWQAEVSFNILSF